MMSNWETKRLGNVLQKTETVNPLQRPDKEFQYIDVSSVNNVTYSIENTTLLKGKDAPSRARKLVHENDIIFATVRPTLKRIAIIPKELDHQVCSTGYFVLRPNSSLDHKLLFYHLLTDDFNNKMEKLQRGTSYPAVTDGQVKDTIISFPKSLREQQCIVSILDEAFAAIAAATANAEKNLQNARELFESYLESFFANPGGNWIESKMGDFCTKIGSGATPRGGNESYKTQGISLIRSLNVHDRKFKKDKLAFIDEKQAKDLSNVTLEANDVLLNITGASIARCCVMPAEYLPARVNQHVSIIRPMQNKVDSSFLNYLLTSNVYKSRLLYTGDKAGATRQALTKAQLEDFQVSFPSTIKEQQSIVAKFDELSTETIQLEAIYQRKISELDELKKSILHQAFTGQLTGPKS